MKKKSNKLGSFKNYAIVFLLLTIVFGAFFVYFYPNYINNLVADTPYSSNVFFDFEDDEIGTFPVGWSGSQWDGTQVVVWKRFYEPYGQVAELMNRDGDGVELATRFKKAKRGTIEFDIFGDKDELINIDITQVTHEYDYIDDIIIHLGGDDSAIKIRDGNNNYVKVCDFSINTWYHFKIEFNLENWDLWINGNHIYEGFNFNHYEVPEYYCQLYFSTYIDNNMFYVDNIDITVLETI